MVPDKHPAIALNNVSYKNVQLMLQYIYCGTVDMSLNAVAEFREFLNLLKIEFVQNDEDEDDNDYDSELEIIEPPPPEIIDVEEPTWSDNTVKVELKEEPKPAVDDCIVESLDQAQDMETEPEATRAVIFPKKPSQRIIRMKPNPVGKISVERVVPSRKMKEFMNENPQTCPFCRKLFKTTKHRNEHVKYCFDNPDRIVSKCPLCSKSVCDPYYLRKHLRTVHDIEPV